MAVVVGSGCRHGFNAHVGVLWARFATCTRRGLAATAGLSRAAAGRQIRVVFAKVAEFQARGVVHLHAIIRLDGSGGPGTPPAPWATTDLLEQAVQAAAHRAAITTPASRRTPARRLVWGRQLDIRRITASGDLPEIRVARYVAKYATKAAEAAGVDLGPIYCRACDGRGITTRTLCHRCGGTGRRPGVNLQHLPRHTRQLVDTCWSLGAQPAYAGLRLRRYAHTLGYRGHFATKSRAYSTTFAALRAERQRWTDTQRAQQPGFDPEAVAVVGYWHYTGLTDPTVGAA